MAVTVIKVLIVKYLENCKKNDIFKFFLKRKHCKILKYLFKSIFLDIPEYLYFVGNCEIVSKL